MFFDPTYFLIVGPALLLSMWASFRTKSAFKKYSKQKVMNGLTGAQAAKRMLDHANVSDVEIVPTRGYLSDHYNPVNKKLALSEAVYGSNSIAAVGVACHEAGHAIQHATKYGMLGLRSALVPTANIGSKAGYLVMFVGLMLGGASGTLGGSVFLVGVLLFSAVILFQLVTLPVEFDASNRAKALSVQYGIIADSERPGMDKVLNAAALTYVAAAASSLLTLVYFVLRSGFLGGRD